MTEHNGLLATLLLRSVLVFALDQKCERFSFEIKEFSYCNATFYSISKFKMIHNHFFKAKKRSSTSGRGSIASGITEMAVVKIISIN